MTTVRLQVFTRGSAAVHMQVGQGNLYSALINFGGVPDFSEAEVLTPDQIINWAD